MGANVIWQPNRILFWFFAHYRKVLWFFVYLFVCLRYFVFVVFVLHYLGTESLIPCKHTLLKLLENKRERKEKSIKIFVAVWSGMECLKNDLVFGSCQTVLLAEIKSRVEWHSNYSPSLPIEKYFSFSFCSNADDIWQMMWFSVSLRHHAILSYFDVHFIVPTLPRWCHLISALKYS